MSRDVPSTNAYGLGHQDAELEKRITRKDGR